MKKTTLVIVMLTLIKSLNATFYLMPNEEELKKKFHCIIGTTKFNECTKLAEHLVNSEKTVLVFLCVFMMLMTCIRVQVR